MRLVIAEKPSVAQSLSAVLGLSIALSCIVGGLFGAIAGYYGGKLDNVTWAWS